MEFEAPFSIIIIFWCWIIHDLVISIYNKRYSLLEFYVNVFDPMKQCNICFSNDESRGYEIGVYQNWSIY